MQTQRINKWNNVDLNVMAKYCRFLNTVIINITFKLFTNKMELNNFLKLKFNLFFKIIF